MLKAVSSGLLSRCILAAKNVVQPLSVKEIPAVFATSSFSTMTLPSKLLQPWKTTPLEDLTCSSAPSQVSVYVPSRGMKVVGRVRRRCKDCQFVFEEGMLHNYCKTHPRHKQRLRPQYWENLRILTHASQKPKRPW